jgi:Domain of unknown function (DUF4440)
MFLCITLPVIAQDCRSVLGQQSADAASLRQVEDKWDEAFLRGKTEYLECLLAPDYASISPKGTHDRAWELEHASKNKGSSEPITEVPGMTFEVHGNTGVVRLFKPASADGKQPPQYMADIFAFEDGAWRAVYSQHTTVASESK